MKRVMIFCIAILYCISSYSQTFTQGNLTYNVINRTEKKVSVKAKDTSISGDIIIPDKVTNDDIEYKVTNLEPYAFSECNINSIIIPNTIKAIERCSFYRCVFLELINLNDSIIIIGDNAFAHCSSLKNITLPNSIINIERSAFSYSSLESIELPNNISELGESVFYACKQLKSVNIPDNVECSIYDYAFSECIKLENIMLPNNITYIGIGVFSGCSSLSSIVIPEKIKIILPNTFADCISLSSVYLTEGITNLENRSFYNCTSLESITIPSSVVMIYGEVFCNSGIYNFYFKPKNAPNLVGQPFKGLLEDIHIHIQQGALGYTKENGYPGIIVEDLEVTSVPKITNDVNIYSYNGKIYVKSDIAENINIYSITGIKHTVNVSIGLNEFTFPKGIYIVKGQKIIVQ